MTSLWLDTSPVVPTDAVAALGAETPFDEVVVGAGLTGLVTALLFARRGRRVAVLEARSVGAGATGNTTAKLSLLQGAHLQRIRRNTYQAVVDAYVAGNRAGFDWMIDYLDEAAVPVERRDAFSYSTTRKGLALIDDEYLVARRAGLPVVKEFSLDLPFGTTSALKLPDQAQFDPMQVVASLVADIRALGGVVVEGVRVTGVSASNPAVAHTASGDVVGRRIHLTTGTPILDRGLYFAKLTPQRSYAMAFEGAGQLPGGMYLSVDGPSRSIRSRGDLLLTVGNGHGVGRAESESALVDDLTDWTLSHWPGARRTHVWSAQDYATPHHVPFVGWLPRGRGRVYLATGYEKWGMTNAVQAALTIVSDVMGDPEPWMTTLHHRATTPIAMASGVGSNAATAVWAAKGWLRALSRRHAVIAPPEGVGVVALSRGLVPVARSTVEGRVCSLSAVCPHLGGIVTWNDAERSWDCPLHGSRFDADGRVLEGPSTRDMTRRG
ncbi:FAD-dependent oxidoreductase [Frigoribacterium sp. 2-23]|uniref:FAD-dependent oxidoreductase n=1 Tax=Frigoribacterium sp. 2-23 TaxID=3415006 RepID=UPI003C6F66EB